MPSVKFFTLGCKANQYDTQVLREQFLRAGIVEAGATAAATICVVNTCTVTGRADAESLNLIRRARRENPAATVVATGCLTERDADKIRALGNRVRIVRAKDRPEILKLLSLSVHPQQPAQALTTFFSGHTRVFLKVQDGCDNHCSYCKVPLVRGRARSMPLLEAVRQAQALVAHGAKEIVLTGICLGSYGKDLAPVASLVDLLAALEKQVSGLTRLRLSSIEAKDISPALITRISRSRMICPHLHIPIQSGDTAILKKMNRRYTRRGYLALVRRIRRSIPGVAITTDCLVGFPGEEERHFRNTLKLVRQLEPLRVHIFPYSRRPGTAAAALDATIPPQVVRQRCDRMRRLAAECSRRYCRYFLGTTREVLCEEKVKGRPGYWCGYTDNYLKVRVKSRRNLRNQIVSVRLTKAMIS